MRSPRVDVRLLTTLAGSLSVALENARLVHETRQRNAELAVINSVQDALAGELELQAIYDAVGDKIRKIFDAQVVDIAIYDEATGLLQFPYIIERGERLEEEPIALVGFASTCWRRARPLLIDEIRSSAEMERYGNPPCAQRRAAQKSVSVGAAYYRWPGTGVISLQNVDRPHAFTDSDQQLLETLAASLSVALENARLVHETRQRNAELALINSVQEALAGELEMQAIYDAGGRQDPGDLRRSGRRHRHLRRADRARRTTRTRSSGVAAFPTSRRAIENSSSNRQVIETRSPCLINEYLPTAASGASTEARRAGRAGEVRALRPTRHRRQGRRA